MTEKNHSASSHFQFNDEWIQTFVDSTILTFRIQCRMEVVLKESYFKGEQPQRPFDVGSIIGITSPSFRGAAFLGFSTAGFLAILSHLFNETIQDIDHDSEDAAAELLNIIFSNVKTALNKKGYELEMAIPSVIRGNQIEANYAKGQKIRVLAFQTEGGEFYVELISKALEKGEAVQSSPKKSTLTPKQKAAFCIPFIQGTAHTIKVQCGLDIKPGKPFDKVPQHLYPFDIAGIVGITSNSLEGSFILVFQQPVFLKLASLIFNETYTSLVPDLDDLVAELVNISLGYAKKQLNEQGHGLQMAIPTIIRGTEIHASSPKGRKVLVVPFTSDIGEFHVEIDLRP